MFVFWIFKVTDPLPYRSSCRSTVIATIAKPPTIQLQKTFCPDFSHLASKCCLAVKKKKERKKKQKNNPSDTEGVSLIVSASPHRVSDILNKQLPLVWVC